MTSQVGSQAVAVTSPGKSIATAAWKGRGVGVATSRHGKTRGRRGCKPNYVHNMFRITSKLSSTLLWSVVDLFPKLYTDLHALLLRCWTLNHTLRLCLVLIEPLRPPLYVYSQTSQLCISGAESSWKFPLTHRIILLTKNDQMAVKALHPSSCGGGKSYRLNKSIVLSQNLLKVVKAPNELFALVV